MATFRYESDQIVIVEGDLKTYWKNSKEKLNRKLYNETYLKEEGG